MRKADVKVKQRQHKLDESLCNSISLKSQVDNKFYGIEYTFNY